MLGGLPEHRVKVAGRLRRAHHVHQERREGVLLSGEGLAQASPPLEVGGNPVVYVTQACARCLVGERANGGRDRDTNANERRELFAEENDLLRFDLLGRLIRKKGAKHLSGGSLTRAAG